MWQRVKICHVWGKKSAFNLVPSTYLLGLTTLVLFGRNFLVFCGRQMTGWNFISAEARFCMLTKQQGGVINGPIGCALQSLHMQRRRSRRFPGLQVEPTNKKVSLLLSLKRFFRLLTIFPRSSLDQTSLRSKVCDVQPWKWNQTLPVLFLEVRRWETFDPFCSH